MTTLQSCMSLKVLYCPKPLTVTHATLDVLRRATVLECVITVGPETSNVSSLKAITVVKSFDYIITHI